MSLISSHENCAALTTESCQIYQIVLVLPFSHTHVHIHFSALLVRFSSPENISRVSILIKRYLNSVIDNNVKTRNIIINKTKTVLTGRP